MMEALRTLTVYEIVGRLSVVVVCISGLIQFTPIKLNPWSWLAKHIGKAINGELMETLGDIRSEVDSIKVDMKRDRAENQRTKIIRFGSEIRIHQRHSRDYFDEIMNDITEYERYCSEHPDFKNNITESTSRLIIATYEKCLRENDFL